MLSTKAQLILLNYFSAHVSPDLKISGALLWLKAVASQNVRYDRAVNKAIKKIKTRKQLRR